MPYYLLVHNIAMYPESQDDWIDQWREIRKNAHGDVEWVHSFFDPAEGNCIASGKQKTWNQL